MVRFFIRYCVLFICISFCSNATEAVTPIDIDAINQEITGLKAQLKNMELDKENEDVDMQKYMIADWSKYSKNALQVKSKEEFEEKLLKRIHELEKQKTELLNRQYK